MIKPVLYIILLLQLFSNQLTAQENLVPNGSFEEFTSCPLDIGEIKCPPWFSPTETTPDFYTPCSPFQSGAPVNAYGNQHAFHGISYMGITLCGEDGYREYIAVKLLSPLIPLKKYLLKFYVSSSDFTNYASNNIGAYFVQDTVGLPLQTMIGQGKAIITSSNMVFSDILITDTANWIEVSFEYTASGCEEYLIIGNFRTMEQTTFGQNIGGTIDSYYYIDEVSLKEQSSAEIPNIFTPNGDGINDFFAIGDTKAKHTEILNRWGNLVYEGSDAIQWNGNDQPDGIYYYTIDFGCGTESNIKTGFVQLMR